MFEYYNSPPNYNSPIKKEKFNKKFPLTLKVITKKYLEYLTDSNIPIVFAIGPAGTGKTFLACYYAKNFMN